MASPAPSSQVKQYPILNALVSWYIWLEHKVLVHYILAHVIRDLVCNKKGDLGCKNFTSLGIKIMVQYKN